MLGGVQEQDISHSCTVYVADIYDCQFLLAVSFNMLYACRVRSRRMRFACGGLRSGI